jgi:hypothetical protein
MGAKSYVKEEYENIPARGVEENKAKQSQFQVSSGERGGEKRDAG